MADEELKKYCITIIANEVTIMAILPMNEELLNVVNTCNLINLTFHNGCQITFNKDFLESFTVELVQ